MSLNKNYAKLGLGTVQLGLPYGIANTRGQPSRSEAFAILQTACDAGIHCFDTASSYGSSEELLGQFFSRSPQEKPRISTKVSALARDGGAPVAAQIQDIVEKSLDRLGTTIDCLLFHRAHDLIDFAEDAVQVLAPYQQRGQIRKTGASIYAPDEIPALLQAYPVQVIQAPVNIFDHRILAPETQALLAGSGIELHGRSVYLQGLLCMDEQQLPGAMAYAAPYLRQYRELCRAYQLPQEQAAFVYVRDLPELACFFVGCESKAQLEQNLAYLDAPPLPQGMRAQIGSLFGQAPIELINPVLWNK